MLKFLKQITIVLVIAATCSVAFAQNAQIKSTQKTWENKSVKQAEWKRDCLSKVAEFINAYKVKKRMFADWICLGKMSKYNERMNQPNVYIEISPSLKSMAEYQTGYQTILIRIEPKNFVYAIDFKDNSAFLLWHEAIHAISHGHQNGSIKPSRPFKSAPRDVAPDAKGNVLKAGTIDAKIDHFYINWAESCILGLPFLEKLEEVLKSNGKTVPPPDVQAKSQKLWKQFLKNCNQSIYGELPDDKERKELEDMMGFHFDTTEILNGYLNLGYPIEYFGGNITDDQVWKLFPTAKQVGTVGLKMDKKKSQLGKLSANYVKSWAADKSGRRCAIHMTIYGSDKISQATWKSTKSNFKNKTEVPNVGDDAFFVDRGPNSGYHAFAKFGNVQIFMTDMNVSIPDKGPITIKRLPVNWNYVKVLFRNIEALPIPPIPAGIATSIEELKKRP